MKTCKYCGSQLSFMGETDGELYFDCAFCDILFPLNEICTNRNRKMSVPTYYDDDYMVSTEELLKRDTIGLYHVLQNVRADWYNSKSSLSILKKQKNEANIEKEKVNTIQNLYDQMYSDYKVLTKKKFVIENIICERTGYLVEKVTDDFLKEIIFLGKKQSSKKMRIYV